jgi:hypothetical protein
MAISAIPTGMPASLALGLVLDSEATVGDDGTVVGDPTEAAIAAAPRRGRPALPRARPAGRAGACRGRESFGHGFPARYEAVLEARLGAPGSWIEICRTNGIRRGRIDRGS